MSKKFISVFIAIIIMLASALVCQAEENERLIEYSPQYEMISYFYDGKALTQTSEGQYCIIDTSNNVLASEKTNISYYNNEILCRL